MDYLDDVSVCVKCVKDEVEEKIEEIDSEVLRKINQFPNKSIQRRCKNAIN
ncbi:MAG: hypothetical protein K2P17_01995 [Helicobacteraceae bacterium]|nr:hypothetical protein [Helicobacteraceae bacterium]